MLALAFRFKYLAEKNCQQTHPAKIKSVVAYTYHYYRTVTTFAWQCFEKSLLRLLIWSFPRYC